MAIETGSKAYTAAFRQGSAWGTPVAVGATYGFRLSRESVTGGYQSLPRDHIAHPWGDAPDIGVESWTGAIEGDAFYGGNVPEIWSYAFGTSGAPSGATAYTHTTDLANSLAKFFTLAISKRTGQKPWEYDSAMIRRLTIRGAGRDRVTWTADLIAGRLDRDSSTNTTTEMAAITVPTLRKAVLHTDGTFRINAQSGAALQASDAVRLSAFELTIARPLATDFQTGARYVVQPTEEGPCEVTLRTDLQSYDAETYLALWDDLTSPTERKADITFSSGVSVNGTDLSILLQFPRLVLMEQPQATMGGPGRIPHSLMWRCLVASAAPTGMTGVTQPVRMVNVDEDGSAYLA